MPQRMALGVLDRAFRWLDKNPNGLRRYSPDVGCPGSWPDGDRMLSRVSGCSTCFDAEHFLTVSSFGRDFVCHTRVGDWCTSSGAIGEVITAMGTECDYTPAHITVVSEKEYNDVRASRIVLIQTAGSEPPGSAAGDGNGDTRGGGLATQIKIAIGLSVPLALLIAGIAGFLIWTRRKRKHKPSASSSDRPSSATHTDTSNPSLKVCTVRNSPMGKGRRINGRVPSQAPRLEQLEASLLLIAKI